ncbi:hypothetical protein D3C75_704390 [compost metagenome]
MDDLQPVNLAQLRYNLAAGQPLDRAQLGVVVIHNSPSEKLGIRTKDLYHITGMKAAFNPFYPNRQQAVPAMEQRFYCTFIYIQGAQRGGHEAKPLFLNRQGRERCVKIGTFAGACRCQLQIARFGCPAYKDGHSAACGDFGRIDLGAHAASAYTGARSPGNGINLRSNLLNTLIPCGARMLARISAVQAVHIRQNEEMGSFQEIGDQRG